MSVRSYVETMASQHGIVYVRSGNDALADVVTRLSDDDIRTDATEDLLVALKRAKVIDGLTMIALLGRHLNEKGRLMRKRKSWYRKFLEWLRSIAS